MLDILIHGSTEHSPAMRHEVPLAIMDPFVLIEAGGHRTLLTNALEAPRLARVLPDARLLQRDDLG